MAWNNRMDSDLEQKKGALAKLLDDLTTLEINTIIKKGMTAAPPPESIEENVQGLLERYKTRMDRIIYTYGNEVPVDMDFDFENDFTFKDFHDHLIYYKDQIDILGKNGIRLEDQEYTRIIRMLSFCEFIKSRSDDKAPDISIKGSGYEGKTLYTAELKHIKNLKILCDTRDMVKIKRFYDLGDEVIVMQTRFSIDGDIVTRIEENFSNKPKELITEIHDEHTNMSVNYWKSLIDIAKGIVFGG